MCWNNRTRLHDDWGFIQNYTTNPAGPIALERSTILTLVTLSAIVWAAFTWISASLSDRFGRKKMYILGALLQLGAAFVVFPLVDTATYSGIAIALFLLSMGVGFTHGINAIVYTELFPASIRFRESQLLMHLVLSSAAHSHP